MPRQARIDAPGALHHIICRGIERGTIFQNDEDREDFIRRLSIILPQSDTRCYAWALIPNHFHLLLKTGSISIAKVMQKLLTGYAVSYNRRHTRHGHLFQNRYKSILCQEETYLLQLVRYIHLNPLKAHLVDTLEELNSYRYCGHSFLLGTEGLSWQETDEVLLHFSETVTVAKQKYTEYLLDGLNDDENPDLAGGGLLRSCGGWDRVARLYHDGVLHKSDERILGDSEFVENALSDAGEKIKQQAEYQQSEIDFVKLLAALTGFFDVEKSELLTASKKPIIVKVRSLLCFLAVRKLGMTASAVANHVNMTQPAVSRSVERGSMIASALNLDFEKLIKV